MAVSEQELVAKFQALLPAAQEEAFGFVEQLVQRERNKRRLRVLEEIDDLVNTKSADVWREVPADSSTNVDHYLYSTPKQK